MNIFKEKFLKFQLLEGRRVYRIIIKLTLMDIKLTLDPHLKIIKMGMIDYNNFCKINHK